MRKLNINRSGFFALLNNIVLTHINFYLAYRRETPAKIPIWVEKEIVKKLTPEKNLLSSLGEAEHS